MNIVLLGPQRLRPTLTQAVSRLGLTGPLATITAGWQEREDDDRDLHEHLGGKMLNLKVYARAEEVFRRDPELAAAHRARQERLREMQEFYRVRLEYALEAARAIGKRVADPALVEEERQLSIDAVRDVDERHFKRCQTLHDEFEARMKSAERESIVRHRTELAALIRSCAGVAIAGGHVAVLRNRLELFDMGGMLRELGLPIFAWAGGAMVITERVVLFHDSPPQGAGNAEILDAGLGLVRKLVALPDPRLRLRLDDKERVALFAGRFAPAACVAMDHGAITYHDGERFTSTTGTLGFRADGTTAQEWIPARKGKRS